MFEHVWSPVPWRARVVGWWASERFTLMMLAIIYLLSRLGYIWAGVRLDMGMLAYGYQFIDPELLRTDLFKSLFYLHSQPPLFNLILGLAIKAFPQDNGQSFLILSFVALGLVNILAMYRLMRAVGAGQKVSFLLVVLFIFNPVTILYENFLFYTHLTMALLTLSTLWLERFLVTRRLLWLYLFFVTLVIIVLTRSLFHLVWLLVISVGVWLLCALPQRRAVKMAAVIACLVVAGWYGKNYWLFGKFGASSWLGLNYARMWTSQFSLAEREEMAAAGLISPISLLKPFSPIPAYQHYLGSPEPMGHPVVDAIYKSTGSMNFNHLSMLEVSEHYWRDAFQVIRVHPEVLLFGQLRSWGIYFRPASHYILLSQGNMVKVHPLDRFYRTFYYLQFAQDDLRSTGVELSTTYVWRALQTISITLLLGTLLLIFYIPWHAKRLWARGNRTTAIVLLYAWFNIIYVALVGNLLEVGENNRFRYMVEPLWIILVALFLTTARRRFSLPSMGGTRPDISP